MNKAIEGIVSKALFNTDVIIINKLSQGFDITQFYNRSLQRLAEVVYDDNALDVKYTVEFFAPTNGRYGKVGMPTMAPNYACACIIARDYAAGKSEAI